MREDAARKPSRNHQCLRVRPCPSLIIWEGHREAVEAYLSLANEVLQLVPNLAGTIATIILVVGWFKKLHQLDIHLAF